jgi:DNA polymerase III delta subunit
MFFLYTGTDRDKTLAKAAAMVEALRKKRPDSAFISLSDQALTQGRLEELVAGQGLFDEKSIVRISGAFVEKELGEFVAKHWEDFKLSPNAFVFVEEKINKVPLEKAGKFAEKLEVFDLPERKRGEFNAFALSDALGARDRKALWALYREAIAAEVECEELCGVLFWQVKSMFLAQDTKSAAEADLNPFVYGKAKRYAGNYKEGELAHLSGELVLLYHEAHRGKRDFELGLEQLLLKV